MIAAVKTKPKTATSKHNCDHTLNESYPRHDQANDGERWVCTCGKIYEHFCDEAEGCYWCEVKKI